MDLHKLKFDDLKSWDQAKIRETEAEVRRSLATIRMDIYTAKSAHAAKIRGLRKSLARLLTAKTQQKAAAAAK